MVHNNAIRGNLGHGLYILLDQSKTATVTNNLIDGHDGVGVSCKIDGAGGAARIVDNTIVNTTNDGIQLKGIGSGEVCGNTIMYAKKYGLSLQTSYDSRIYLNNFLNNIDDVDIHNSTNTGNSAHPLPYVYDGAGYVSKLGNNWGSYQGVDEDNDGIGDVPQSLGQEQDDYPIMSDIMLGDPNLDSKVNGQDLVTVKRIILGEEPPTPQADCDSNKLVDGRDLICINKKIVGILY